MERGALVQGRVLVMVALSLGALAPRAGADASVKPTAGKRGTMQRGAWRIVWQVHMSIDHGDGVIRGHEDHAIEVSPAGTRIDNRAGPALPREKLAALAALVPALVELRGPYQWSQFVDDEGSHDESIVVTSGERTVEIGLMQGRGVPAPPEVLQRAYELVVGKPLPSASGH